MTDLPQPLTSTETDLRNFSFTPMFRSRLFGSSFHSRVSDSGWRAGVTLWLKSWDQVPAGSLPDDDIDLCRLAELGRDQKSWRKVKEEALWGWFKCSDGRLYHHVVAEGVNEAWQGKIAQRDRTEKARATKLAKHQSQSAPPPATASVAQAATDSVTEDVTASNRKGERKGKGSADARAREVDEQHFSELHRLLAFDAQNFQNWMDFIAMQAEIGLDYAAHILPAAEHHARSGKLGKTLAYIRPKAIEIRDQAKVAASMPVHIEEGTDADWAARLQAYLDNPTFAPDIRWPAKWGKPFERVPPKVLEKFQSRLNANGSGSNAR